MSKIICDVCGTSYPETSTQCPICGCVRPAETQSVPADGVEETAVATYHHVKGGRFSKNNVKKRTASAQASSARGREHVAVDVREKKPKKDAGTRGLVITIFVLLLAILAVLAYIVIKFLLPSVEQKPQDTVITGTPSPSLSVSEKIACQQIVLENSEASLDEIGKKYTIKATVEPADTTETLSYISGDESVATVDSLGVVTAVGYGDTIITAVCGSQEAQFKISVTEGFALDVTEVVLDSIGSQELIYSGSINVKEITWSSDDEKVATIVNGYVTAIAEGTTTVYGEYNGTKLSCSVTCTVAEETTEGTEAPAASSQYTKPYHIENLYGLYDHEATVKVDESFQLELWDANGKKIDGVKWKISEGSSCTVENGKVKAVSTGVCTVTATYDGETFNFKVIVR